MSRVLGIIVGVLTVILGVWCFMTPIETYGVIGWLITFALIADGISKIMVWNDYRKIGVSDTWALVGGILSIILGITFAFNIVARVFADIFIAYVLAAWILFGGFVRIIRSFQMRDIHKNLGTTLGSNWGLALVMGILMVILGIFCMANPTIVMIATGWQISFALVLGGIGLITATA